MKKGLTLIEILMASVLLALALLGLLQVSSSSQQTTMDAYFELLALKIAQEPLDVFKCVGYPECATLPNYPVGKTVPLTTANGRYPVEAAMFERRIDLDLSAAPLYVVTVSVSPLPDTKAQLWMKKNRNCIVLKGIVPVYK